LTRNFTTKDPEDFSRRDDFGKISERRFAALELCGKYTCGFHASNASMDLRDRRYLRELPAGFYFMPN